MNQENKSNETQSVFKEGASSASEATDISAQKGKTSSGLDENVAGSLCYAIGFITGIVFLLVEKDNKFVRFHAWQSIFVFGALFVLNLVLTAIPIIGWLIGIILIPVIFILWIYLMLKAYQGKWVKLPIVGELAEKQLSQTAGKEE